MVLSSTSIAVYKWLRRSINSFFEIMRVLFGQTFLVAMNFKAFILGKKQ